MAGLKKVVVKGDTLKQFKAIERKCDEAIRAVTGVTTYILGRHCESELSVRPVGVERKESIPHTHTGDNMDISHDII